MMHKVEGPFSVHAQCFPIRAPLPVPVAHVVQARRLHEPLFERREGDEVEMQARDRTVLGEIPVNVGD